MPLTRVRLHELSELEPRVIAALGSIEKGLTPLTNQLGVGASGRPDILAVDSSGTLALLELKSDIAGVAALDQAVRYHEWASQNLALLAKPFPSIRHDQHPRIFIVAPEFDDGVRRIVRYLDIDVTLVVATCVCDVESKYTGVLFDVLDIDKAPQSSPLLRSEEDIISYITDSAVREEFKRVLNAMREAGLQVQPYSGGKDFWLAGMLGVLDVACVQARRTYFNWEFYDDDGQGKPVKLRSHEEWTQKAQPDFMKWLADAKAKAL